MTGAVAATVTGAESTTGGVEPVPQLAVIATANAGRKIEMRRLTDSLLAVGHSSLVRAQLDCVLPVAGCIVETNRGEFIRSAWPWKVYA